MADQLQLRGGTTTEHSTFTGALREVTVDTTKDTVVVHDNATAGGHPLAKEDLSNVAAATAATKLANQTVAFGAGAAGTPSVTFSGDTNTGIYSPGADQVAISTNGTGRLFIASDGKIGVGTSSPFALFQTSASATGNTVGAALVNSNDSGSADSVSLNFGLARTGGLTFYGASIAALKEQAFTGTPSTIDASLVFSTIQDETISEKMRLTSAGRLGLGTSSPQVALDSRSSSNGLPATSGTTPTNGVFRIGSNSTTGVIDIGCNGTAPWIQATDRTDLSQKYSLLLNPNGGSVGIGTASVNTTLEVQNSSTPIIRVGDGTRHMELRGGSTTQNAAIGTSYNGSFDIIQNGNAAVTIDTSKRVLVGTSSAPTGSKSNSLTVNEQLLVSPGLGIYSGSTGSITATTGTIVFTFKNTTVNQRAAMVRLSVASRSTSNTASNSPCAQYQFQLFKTSTTVCSLNGAASIYEYTFVRATHFAFADAGSGVCTVTLTNPTGQALLSQYKVEILGGDGSLSWTLDSVAVT